jgi:hypothetical protein
MRGAIEECPVCLQLYCFELERRCEGCDTRMCPWCVVEVKLPVRSEAAATEASKTRGSKRVCPECTESEDASARDVES